MSTPGAEQTFVIVGASLAGAKAAETLRAESFMRPHTHRCRLPRALLLLHIVCNYKDLVGSGTHHSRPGGRSEEHVRCRG